MKRLLKLSLAATATVVLAACASTADVKSASNSSEVSSMSKATVPATEKVASAEDKEVCRRYAVSGPNFKRKVCKTAAEWEADRERSQKGTAEFQRRGAIQKVKGN